MRLIPDQEQGRWPVAAPLVLCPAEGFSSAAVTAERSPARAGRVVTMQTADKDVLDLLDHAWERLWNRMAGLTDREWSWRPVDADDKITIRWRLFHIAEVLTQSRNWTWLAVTPPEAKLDNGGADCAQDALASVDSAYAAFRELVTFESVDLTAAIGPAAGPYGSATRRSLVLRITDELIHHGAEAALLRDLYASRTCH